MRAATWLVLLMACRAPGSDKGAGPTGDSGDSPDPGSDSGGEGEGEGEGEGDSTFETGDSGTPLSGVGRLRGVALDAWGGRLAGVTVGADGLETSTTRTGSFSLDPVDAGEDVVLSASAEGFVPTAQRVRVPPDTWTYAAIRLADAERFEWDASSPTTLETSKGLTITLPAEGLVDESGDPWLGLAVAEVAFLQDPGDAPLVPGPLMTEIDGARRLLESVGVVGVSLHTEEGVPLQLAGSAQISFSFNDVTLHEPVSALSLYGFDAETGLWAEQGAVALDFGSLSAEVAHFSWWAGAAPADTDQCVVVTLHDPDGDPLADATVLATEETTLSEGDWTTDSDGFVQIDLPKGTTVTLQLAYGAYAWRSDPITLPDSVATTRPDDCTDLGVVTMLPADGDGDGYISSTYDGDDCDDGDDAIHPGAAETCYDGTDQDCDGDDDLDLDLDGYDAVSCGGTDCDDDDATISPAAEEIWYDGVDEDCDGSSDYDADADGVESEDWGGTDCDDADGTTYPGAPTVCADGAVNDCDGTAEDEIAACVWSGDISTDDARAWYTDDEASSVYFGDAIRVGDLNGTGYAGAGVATVHSATSGWTLDLFAGGDDVAGSQSPYAELPRRVYGTSSSYTVGTGTAGTGDVDGDGYDDLVTGFADDSTTCWPDGTECYYLSGAWLLEGPVDTDGSFADKVGLAASGFAHDDLGSAVAAGGDFNGDGFADVLVGGDWLESCGGDCYGGVAVYLGSDVADPDEQGPFVPESFYGLDATLQVFAVYVASAGDLQGDGLDEVLVTERSWYYRDTTRWGVHVMEGSDDFETYYPPDLASIQADTVAQHLGTALAGAGDINGDGYADFAVGAYEDSTVGSESGLVYLLFGSATMSGALTPDATLYGTAAGDQVGESLSGDGDVDGDGLSDLVIGVPGYDPSGAAWLIYGDAALGGTLSADVAMQATSGTQFGSSVSMLGDMNGDGLDDLAISQTYTTTGTTHDATLWLVLAPGW